MRLILVGTPRLRRRLRNQLDAGAEVVAEFESLDAARSSGIAADAILLAAPPTSHDDDADADEDLSTGALSEEDLSAGAPAQAEALTPREIEVLELVAEGLPNKVIATRLGISDQTVKFHLSSIIGKLGASNRTDAVRRAMRRGLITL
jgi:DNA-binding NarL/FixJ family response regulator